MNARPIILALLLTMHAPDVSYAQAGGQQALGQFNDWTAYAATGEKGKVCFVISQPTSRAPEGLKRDPAYLFITHRPADKVQNEVSVQVGFPARAGSPAVLAVGSDSFNLLTQGERAWSNGQDDGRIVDAMRRGSDLTMRTTSTRGNVTTDTYSLRGVSAALDRINQECR